MRKEMKVLISFIMYAMVTMSAVAGTWPEKPITIIIPYAPGGINDLVARAVVDDMSLVLKTPVVVQYQAGGNGIIASTAMLNADPNYTFMMGDQININGSMANKTDHYTKLKPVMIFASSPYLLARSKKVSPDHILQAIKDKKQIQVAVPGLDISSAIWIRNQRPIDVQMIPYKGGALVKAAVVMNHVDYGSSSVATFWDAINNNQIEPVFIASDKRNPLLPNVPTAKELKLTSIPNTPKEVWIGLIVNKSVDQEIVEKLHSVLAFAVSDPKAIKSITSRGVDVNVRNIKQSELLWNKEIADSKIRYDLQ
jgi:tripartite-type tricarboxylate transporter receptor subunit TctC